MLSSVGLFLREQFGEDTLEKIAKQAGLAPTDLDGANRWASMSQLRTVLQGLRTLCPDDAAFQAACSYKLKEAYGPLRFLFMAATPRLVYSQAIGNFHLVSRVSRYEVEFPGRNEAICRYASEADEGRLLCLSRQSHATALPTLWGLPPAHLTEGSCIARGDSECVYHLRWYQPRVWFAPAAGAAAGVLGAWALAQFAGLTEVASYVTLPALGALLGEVAHLRQRNRANLATGEQINNVLRSSIEENSGARREIIELHQRERGWARTLEEEVRVRTTRLETMIEQLGSIAQERESTVLGLSHDLRNPLTMLLFETDELKDRVGNRDAEADELLESHRQNLQKMKELISDLVQQATAATDSPRTYQTLEVSPLAELMRQRLRALVYGKDIRVSCFATREAPTAIRCPVVVFDRIVDNLLTNAAKYSERGSIVVELDGTPGFLTIKVSDTGCGIPADRIERIFERGQRGAHGEEGYGIGLTVVVDLLDELGGRLEVKSTVGTGTTFWAHFPTDPKQGGTLGPDAGNSAIDRVVHIRRPTMGGS